MAVSTFPGSDDLRALADQKEKEWRDAQKLRVEHLEVALKQKDKELQEERSRLEQLKADFKYNLKLVHERDAELEKYDSVFGELKTAINDKNTELSELCIKVDNLNTTLTLEREQRDELQQHYQQRIREKQVEFDKYRCEKDQEVKVERDQLELYKRNLECQLRELEEEFEIQKREMNTGFESAIKKQEQAHKLLVDKLNTTVQAHEMKVKLLSKELEQLKSTQEKEGEELSCMEGQQRELEKALKQARWQLEDTKAMNGARISELETVAQQTEMLMKRQREEFQRKYAEMDRQSREHASCLTKAKKAHCTREGELQASLNHLQSKLEEGEIEMRRQGWSHSDAIKEKDVVIEKLQDELNKVKEKWSTHVAETSRNTVERDLEMQSLRDNDEKQKTSLACVKQDIVRYKKDLKDSIEREAALERSKAQLDIDWQRRYEDTQRSMYTQSEELVSSLTTAHNHALAEVKELKRVISEKEKLIKTLHKDRDKAFATLRQYNITIDHTAEEEGTTDNLQVADLKRQNDNLRTVIRQMREDMEQLGHVLPPDDRNNGDTDYSNQLEAEVSRTKAKNRELQLEIEQLRQPSNHDKIPNAVLKDMADNTLVRTHVESLNSMVGSLRSEKMELAAQVKKSQARIEHLERLNDQLSKQPRQKQVEIEQLHYEVGARSRRYEGEVANLRHRVTELELELTETRREADEYHKANLERNMEAVALGNELSNLKVDMARKNPSVNYGAQELVIQQLQDELSRLRKTVGSNVPFDPSLLTLDPVVGDKSTATSVTQLKQKLRLAANHIRQLAKEKQQLILVGNKLRAELTKAGISLPSQTSSSIPPSYIIQSNQPPGKVVGPLAQKVQNKLNQLEKLQYALTKQELKFANKGVKEKAFKDIQVESSSSGTDPVQTRPRVPQKQLSQSAAASRYTVPERPEMGYRQKPLRAESDSRQDTVSTSQDQQLMTSMSSMGGESLQEVWKILDNPQSPSMFSQTQGSL